MWINGLKFLIVSHHFAKFSDHSSDTTINIFYVTLQDHVIKGSGDFICSLYISTLPPRYPAPLPLKVRSFWLELTLSPSISIFVKFREKKLIMSTSIFGWTLLRSPSGIFKKWTPSVHDKSVRFMEMSALQRVHLRIRNLQK